MLELTLGCWVLSICWPGGPAHSVCCCVSSGWGGAGVDSVVWAGAVASHSEPDWEKILRFNTIIRKNCQTKRIKLTNKLITGMFSYSISIINPKVS